MGNSAVSLDAIALWYIILLLVISNAGMFLSIGIEREPISKGNALWATVFNIGIVLAALQLAGLVG